MIGSSVARFVSSRGCNPMIPSLVIFFEKTSSERKKPVSEKVIDVGAPMLVGGSVGRTLADLSLSTTHGPSPRRKTLGVLAGAAAGLAFRKSQQDKEKRRKAHKASLSKIAAVLAGKTPSQFLHATGHVKSLSQLAPKIGRKGSLPKVGP